MEISHLTEFSTIFEGLVSYSSEEYEGKTHKHRIWSPEAIKIFIFSPGVSLFFFSK